MCERLLRIIIMPVGVIIMRMYDRDKVGRDMLIGEWNYKSLEIKESYATINLVKSY
jgi:hypothetical protein